jgi:hypothetical protein
MKNKVLIEVLNPRGIPGVVKATGRIAQRPGTLDGKTVGLFWSGKPGGDALLSRVGELLQWRFSGVKLVKYFPGKTDVSSAAHPTTIKKVAEQCQIVVNGTLD